MSGPTYRSDRREQALAWAMRQEEFAVYELASGLGVRRANAQKILSRMVADGQVVRVRFGVYRPHLDYVEGHT